MAAVTWPWRRETREDATDYTTQCTDDMLELATGGNAASLELAVTEACSSLWGRSLSSARVEGAGAAVTAAIDPQTLNLIGREMARHGEVAFKIDMVGGALVLIPISDFTVYGGALRSAWVFGCNLTGPTSTTYELLPADQVLYLQTAFEPRRPWLPVAPLTAAKITGRLLAELEQGFLDEATGPRGSVVPVAIDRDKGISTYQRLINAMRGRVALLTSNAFSHVSSIGGSSLAGASDFLPRRYGSNPPAAAVTLRKDAEAAVAAAFGVSPSLLTSTSDGTMARESFRRLLHTTMAPIGQIIAAEMQRKLASPDLRLSWAELGAADTAARGRSFRALVGNGTSPGLTVEQAAGVVGIDLGGGE